MHPYLHRLKLIAITDPSLAPWPSLESAATRALAAGLPALMLRDPNLDDSALAPIAERLLACARQAGALLIVNRRLELARRIGADAIHLGVRGPSLAEARAALGPGALIGYSAHEEDEALAALASGADYVTFSPVFATPSKAGILAPAGLERLQALASRAPGRVVALGGIDATNLSAVMRTGVLGAAVIRAVFGHPNHAQAVKKMMGIGEGTQGTKGTKGTKD